MITNCQEHTECILEYAVAGTEGFEFEKNEGNRTESVGSCNKKYMVSDDEIGTQIEANTGKTGLGDDWRPCRATLDGKLKDGAYEGCWIQYYIFENKTDQFEDGVMKMDIRWEKFNREHHCPFEIQPAMVLGIVGGAGVAPSTDTQQTLLNVLLAVGVVVVLCCLWCIVWNVLITVMRGTGHDQRPSVRRWVQT